MRATNLSQEQWPYRPPATAASWQSPSSWLSCRSGSILFGRMAAYITLIGEQGSLLQPFQIVYSSPPKYHESANFASQI
jgi:hypothetical protein